MRHDFSLVWSLVNASEWYWDKKVQQSPLRTIWLNPSRDTLEYEIPDVSLPDNRDETHQHAHLLGIRDFAARAKFHTTYL